MATIQWYPGHMHKAQRQLQENLPLIDVVVEVLDARLPEASRNPLLAEIIGRKPRVVLLNKADLADPVLTKEWLSRLQAETPYVLALDTQHHTNVSQLVKIIKQAGQAAGKQFLRVAIVGVPNCGKSTVINKLIGKKRAVTGNRPGVTQGQNWLKTNHQLQILDTPGILWPKFTDQEVGYKLAACGAIKDTVFASDDVALYALRFLQTYYPSNLAKFSRLTDEQLQLPLPDLLLEMTQKYGMRDDYERFSLFFLQQLRRGKLGRVTFDR
jgi:ribosome biogenesis GTPase A